MIKAVFFDMHNTLIHYEPTREETQQKALKKFGIDIEMGALTFPIITGDEFFYEEHAKLPLAKRSEADRMSFWGQYESIILKEAGITPTKELITFMLGEMQTFKSDLVLYADVIPTLTEIKSRRFLIGLISNMDKDINPMLEKLKLKPFFLVVTTSQEVGVTKPHPEIFESAIKKAGIKANEAIYIGDQYKIDVLGANNAGMSGVLLDRMDYYKNDGIKEPRIRDLHQLINLLPK